MPLLNIIFKVVFMTDMRKLMMIVEGSSPYPEVSDEEWAKFVADREARMNAPPVPSTPAEDFEDAFDEARAKSGIDPRGKVSLYVRGDTEVELLHITVDLMARGQGVASALMGLLCDMADDHGITLKLGIASDPDEEDGLDGEALHDWYQRWGFEGGTQMVREPYDKLDESVQPKAVMFIPGDVEGRWDVMVAGEKIGTISKAYSGSRRGVGRSADYQARLRYDGRTFNKIEPRMTLLKQAVRDFVCRE